MKYIVINCRGIEVAILFPEAVTHSMAVNPHQVKPVSAGFCTVQESGAVAVNPVAGSESLGLKPRPEQDAAAIELALGLMGLPTTHDGLLNTIATYVGPAWKEND